MGQKQKREKTPELNPEVSELVRRLQEKDKAAQKTHEQRCEEVRPIRETIECVRKLCWGDEKKQVITQYLQRLQITSKDWAPLWCKASKAWKEYPGYENFPALETDATEGIRAGFKLFELTKSQNVNLVEKQLEAYRKALGRSQEMPQYTTRKYGDTEEGIWYFTRQLYEHMGKIREGLERKRRVDQTPKTADATLVDKSTATHSNLVLENGEPVFYPKTKLDPTDQQILKVLRQAEKRLLTGEIAEKLGRRMNKSIGKNLSKLVKLELIHNIPRTGYQITPRGQAVKT